MEKTGTAIKKETKKLLCLRRKTKKDYFNNSNIKNITDSKAFWKTTKPYFSDKGLKTSSLILSEKIKLSQMTRTLQIS